MAFALHRAAPAILASAATVAVGMLCLLFAELNSTAGLGPVTAIGVAVTFLVMVTLLPALLVIFGRWMFWPKRPTFRSPEPTSAGFWARVGRLDRPAPAEGLGGHRRRSCALACLGLFTARRQRSRRPRSSTPRSSTRSWVSRCWSTHGLVDNSNTDHGRRQHRQASRTVAEATRRGRRARATHGPRDPGRRRLHHGRHHRLTSPPRRPSTSSRPPATPSSGIDGADALVGGGSAFYLDTKIASQPRQHGDHPDRAARGVPDPDRCCCGRWPRR